MATGKLNVMRKLIIFVFMSLPFASHAKESASHEEISRLLFNLNMKLVEITRRSENITSNQDALELIKTGCDIDTIRTMVIEGYESASKDSLMKADRCAARLAIALGYHG